VINREGFDTIQAVANQAVVTVFEGMRYRGWAIILSVFFLVSLFGIRFYLTGLFALGLSRSCFW
jgi:hypothetical protein